MSDRIGIDFSSSGSVMSTQQLQEQRRKRGECLTCGQKCYQKKLFKAIPITIHGQVLNGRCLKCNPLEVKNENQVLPATSRPATREDLQRFSRSQSSLRLNPGQQPRRIGSRDPNLSRGPSMASIGEQSNRSPPRLRHTGSSVAADPSPMIHDESQSVRSARSSSDTRMRVRRAGLSDSASVRSERTFGSPQLVNPGGSAPSSRQSSNQSMNGRRLRRGESSRSMESSNSGSYRQPTSPSFGTTSPIVELSPGGSTRSPSGSNRQLNSVPRSGSSSPAPTAAQRQSPSSAASSSSPAGQESSRGNTGEDGVDIHQAVLGGMAAHYLAERFRSRKAAAQTQQAAPAESAPDVAQAPLDNPFGNDRLGTGSTHSTDSWNNGEEENHAKSGPRHGVLNRGGAFPGPDGEGDHVHVPPMASMNAESNRTMSSMSSIEEEPNNNGHHQMSWKPAAEFAQKQNAPAVFEDDGELSMGESDYERHSFRSQVSENRSGRSSRSGGRRRSSINRHFQKQEQKALDQIDSARGNYADILHIMGGIPNSALVQQEGLKDLSNLHLSNSEYGHLAELGALQRVVEAMNGHPHSSEVQVCGCRAIWNLSATTSNQVKLVSCGALDAIVLAMEGFPDDSELQEKAMAALSNLGAAEPNQNRIMERGTLEKIVEAMNNHSEDGAVQSKACSAITNFASYDSPLKQKIMESGGGGAVVIAMIMHPEDVDLQEKALRALRNICANSDENKIEVANVGGIDAVISAMQVHRDEPGVQEAGAWTLSNLAVNPDNKAVIGDSGGIDVVVRAMWVHSDNVGVQEWCCRALWTLSVDAQNRQVMMEVGGISAVVNAMQAHADASTVQEKGCGVLSNLAASDDDSKIRIVEEEALDAIIMAMVLHADNAQVQDRACSVVKRLAIEPNIKAMQAANIGELVRQASQKFPDRCRDKARAILAAL